MKPEITKLLPRIIPALVLVGSVTALAFWWTQPGDRGGTFVYFLFLMIYASFMCFFSDMIFMAGKNPLHVKVPVTAIAIIHAAYVLVLIILFLIVNNFNWTIFFVVASLLATAAQISLSIAIFLGARNIADQQEELDTSSNLRTLRALQLDDLRNAFATAPTLAADTGLIAKLNVMCNTWRLGNPNDTVHTQQVTAEIESAINALTGYAAADDADPREAAAQIAAITACIEKRAKLLMLK